MYFNPNQMKVIKKTFYAILTTALLSNSCKKDNALVNVSLYDKSTSSIEPYLLGKWRVNYLYGGICGTCSIDRRPLNEVLHFFPNNRIVYSLNNSIVADTVFQWRQYVTTQNPTEKIKLITFYDKRGAFKYYEPYEINNDTLILVTPDHTIPDNNGWSLTKIK